MFAKLFNRTSWPVWMGVLFVVGGTLSLLEALKVITLGSALWAGIFAVGGLAFLAIVLINSAQWWAFIPGFALLGLAVAAGSNLAPARSPLLEAGGAAFLMLLGLGFGAVALSSRERWWAIIPLGALLTLAAVAAAPVLLESSERATSAMFFFGLAATFGVLSLLRTQSGRMLWALIPAGTLGLLGLLLLGNFTTALALLGPVTLLVAGMAVLAGYWWRHRHQ